MAQPIRHWFDGDDPIPAELADEPPAPWADDLAAAFALAEEASIEVREAVELAAEQPERWRITDDGGCEWALRKLARAQQEIEELRLRALAWQEKIEGWLAEQTTGPARDAEFFLAHVERFAREQRAEHDRKSVSLPSGKVSTRATAEAAEITDPGVLLAWAREHLPAAVRVREDVQVSTLRSMTSVAGEKVVTADGEPVDGVAVRPARVTVTVEVTP